jgi:branched-chain amino acid transport system permease protein
MGIAPTYHVLAFTMGAVLAGMVGAVSAHFLNTWNARRAFGREHRVLAFVLVGGSRTFIGPVIGGLILTALPEILRGVAGIGGLPHWLAQFLKDGRLIIFGLLLVLGTIFFPRALSPPIFSGACGGSSSIVRPGRHPMKCGPYHDNRCCTGNQQTIR